MTYAYLRLASFVGVFIGVGVYVQFLRNLPIRTMMTITCLINFLAACLQVIFLRGFYFGFRPDICYGLIEMISDSFIIAIESMPRMALVAKLIPVTIESALFAFYTGLSNLNYLFNARLLGNLVNHFVGVTKENLDDLWILLTTQAICSLLPLLFIWLLPTTPEVEAV